MANATYVSDLERAEHLGYADGAGVKRVSVYNNGTQVNAATEETQAAELAMYKITEINGDYFGFTKADGGWYIMWNNSGSWRYLKGDSGFTTAWTNRVGAGYDYFYNIF